MTKRTLAVAMVGGLLWAWVGMLQAQTPPAAPLDPAKVALGKKTFEDTKCTKCHGDEGLGDTDGKGNLAKGAAKMTAADIRKWITSPAEMTAKLPRQPKEAMKKFELTDAQVDGLVAFVQSLKVQGAKK